MLCSDSDSDPPSPVVFWTTAPLGEEYDDWHVAMGYVRDEVDLGPEPSDIVGQPASDPRSADSAEETPDLPSLPMNRRTSSSERFSDAGKLQNCTFLSASC